MRRLQLTVLIAASCLMLAIPAFAQQPYSGLQTRSIKALSDEQIADLRAGRGMSLALAAELNGYPGPAHVLELSEPLGLSESQTADVRNLFAAMRAEAVPIGERLIAQEAELDRLFMTRAITPTTLSDHTDMIGATQAALRATHLKYHLSTLALLTPQQLDRYAELRGYKKDTETPMHHPH